MSVYMTEEEQLEAIKKWWNKYSSVITVILSIILIATASYKYWSWHQYKTSMAASNAYEQLMVSFSNHDNKSTYSFANELINNYNHTVYADAARLTLAKVYINNEKYAQAKVELAAVAENSKVLAFKQIAKIRYARLLASEKQYDQAMAQLSSVVDVAYVPVINELKGDIFAATGKYQEAMTAYKEAITEVRNRGMGNLFLEMKTNELAALTQTLNHESSNIQAV